MPDKRVDYVPFVLIAAIVILGVWIFSGMLDWVAKLPGAH